jgi:hypothetical protein
MPSPYEELMADIARVRELIGGDTVIKLRCHPDTLARLVEYFREAGVPIETVERHDGIPFLPDDTVRPSFIEGVNVDGAIVRMFMQIGNNFYELVGDAFLSYTGKLNHFTRVGRWPSLFGGG